jgi:hypothetical protein
MTECGDSLEVAKILISKKTGMRTMRRRRQRNKLVRVDDEGRRT